MMDTYNILTFNQDVSVKNGQIDHLISVQTDHVISV